MLQWKGEFGKSWNQIMISNWTRLQLVDQYHGDTRDVAQRKDVNTKRRIKIINSTRVSRSLSSL